MISVESMPTTVLLGKQACMLGYRTLYYSMNRFIEALANARLDGSYIKWINTIFLIATPIAALILTPLDVVLHGWDPRLLTFCFLFLIASSLGITGGYHRLFSHRSYDSKPFVKLFYLLFVLCPDLF